MGALFLILFYPEHFYVGPGDQVELRKGPLGHMICITSVFRVFFYTLSIA